MENIINTNATTITENTTLGELLRILSLGEKPHETPTPKMLCETAGEPIAKEERCLVYANGYAVYDNGSGRTVVWLPDCVSFVYYFVKPKESEIVIAPEKFELPEGLLETVTWPIAVTLIGDHRVEENLVNRTGSRIDTKDYDADDNGDKDGDTEDAMEQSYRNEFFWREGRFGENPEDAFIRKETMKEMLDSMTDKQREVFALYYRYGYTYQEIADMLSITKPAVNVRLRNAIDMARKKY